MFKKVLLSEDIDIVAQGILLVMRELKVPQSIKTQYFDDAYLKIVKSHQDGSPFDLLVTDLTFRPDHRPQKIKTGDELIKVLRKDFPDLKIVVYSLEDRPERVRRLINRFKVNAYILKGRTGLKQLNDAILTIAAGGNYISPELQTILNSKPPIEILESDIEILKMLSNVHSQEQISHYLKSNNIKPSSLSALEKRLNVLRDHFEATNAIHLVSIVKDLGLI